MSSRYTNHPVSDEKWYEEKCKDFHDGKCDSYGHEIIKDTNTKQHTQKSSEINPLENPEQYTVRLYCCKCKNRFNMGLSKHNMLTSNGKGLCIQNRAQIKLCPICYKYYLKKQIKLKKNGLFTDEDIEKLANNIKKYNQWSYNMGFIDGFILARDGVKNILSE